MGGGHAVKEGSKGKQKEGQERKENERGECTSSQSQRSRCVCAGQAQADHIAEPDPELRASLPDASPHGLRLVLLVARSEGEVAEGRGRVEPDGGGNDSSGSDSSDSSGSRWGDDSCCCCCGCCCCCAGGVARTRQPAASGQQRDQQWAESDHVYVCLRSSRIESGAALCWGSASGALRCGGGCDRGGGAVPVVAVAESWSGERQTDGSSVTATSLQCSTTLAATWQPCVDGAVRAHRSAAQSSGSAPRRTREKSTSGRPPWLIDVSCSVRAVRSSHSSASLVSAPFRAVHRP